MSERSGTHHSGTPSGHVWGESQAGPGRKALELKLASVLSKEPDLCTSDVGIDGFTWLKLRPNHFQEL